MEGVGNGRSQARSRFCRPGAAIRDQVSLKALKLGLVFGFEASKSGVD